MFAAAKSSEVGGTEGRVGRGNGPRRQSARPGLFSRLADVSVDFEHWRCPMGSKVPNDPRGLQASQKKDQKRYAGFSGKRKSRKTLVVKRDIGRDGLRVRRESGWSIFGNRKERREEQERERVGDGEGPCTTPLNCSLAVWAEGRVNGKLATTWKRRCEELRPRDQRMNEKDSYCY